MSNNTKLDNFADLQAMPWWQHESYIGTSVPVTMQPILLGRRFNFKKSTQEKLNILTEKFLWKTACEKKYKSDADAENLTVKEYMKKHKLYN